MMNENRVVVSNENYIELRNKVVNINNRLIKVEDKVLNKDFRLNKIFSINELENNLINILISNLKRDRN